MDALQTGLRTQDFHESLRATSAFGPKDVQFKRTLLIGKAATLAMHLRGLLYIDDYTQLEYAAATLGISSIELPSILRELEEVDFVSIIRAGEIVKRIDIRVPLFRSAYKDLGERWNQLKPTDIERAGIGILDDLYHGPNRRDRILNSLGLDNTQTSIMLDVMESGLLVATQTVNGVPMIYTPLAVDGNPTTYLQWAEKYPGDISQALQLLRENQGLSITDALASSPVINDAIITGVLMPVEINGATGNQRFVFAPQGGLKPEARVVLDKARAIISCVRYGQKFSAGRPIRYPRSIIRQLLDNKRFNHGHPDLQSQYSLLAEKLIGFPVDEGNGRWNFKILDTDENTMALRTALEMLEYGETPSSKIDIEAQKALISLNSYQGPITSRVIMSKYIRGSSSTNAEIVRQMSNMMRGVVVNE